MIFILKCLECQMCAAVCLVISVLLDLLSLSIWSRTPMKLTAMMKQPMTISMITSNLRKRRCLFWLLSAQQTMSRKNPDSRLIFSRNRRFHRQSKIFLYLSLNRRRLKFLRNQQASTFHRPTEWKYWSARTQTTTHRFTGIPTILIKCCTRIPV